MEELSLKFFNQCLLRTPIFPISKLEDIQNIHLVTDNPYFREAVYLASKPLYEDAYSKGASDEKTRLALLRYFARACTRCTPYGNFAGYTCVDFGEVSDVQMDNTYTFSTYTRVDMDILCRIADTIEKDANVRENLFYHINTSLYPIADRLRYIEYDRQKGIRHYVFSEVISNEYIDKILCYLNKKQHSYSDIVSILRSAEITEIDAKCLVNELIDNQILVSNLEVSIAGEELLQQLQDTLKESRYYPLLSELNKSVRICDQAPLGNKITHYENIRHLIDNMIPHTSTAVFHSDCRIKTTQAKIGTDVQKAFIKGIKLLNRITVRNSNPMLDLFKDAFYQRFEEQEIPLSIALDPQIGIPIGKWNNQYGDENSLIDDIAISRQSNEIQFTFSPFDRLLINKYEELILNKSPYILLTEKDIENLPEEALPSSFGQIYSMIQVLHKGTISDESLIFMNNASLGNPASLLSRFGYSDPSVKQLVDVIARQQQEHLQDKIYVEILHLPEDRIGNIQMHPINRNYGLAYFSNPIDKTGKQKIITPSDIMVSVPSGERIKLRSKEYDKEIIPILSTAHNYTNGLPLYLFLCLIYQQYSLYFHFEWNNFFKEKPYLPQVRFENIILSAAQWAVSTSDLPEIKSKNLRSEDIVKIVEWKNGKNIPDKVMIVEGDNKLYIDFNMSDLVRVFITLLKRNKVLLLEEFLYSRHPNHLVQNGENDWFTNELIISAYYEKD